MSPVKTLLRAVRSWLRRRGGPKTPRHAGVSLEQLDHRQLLAVNFTGIVASDFPATTSPGVVILNADAQDQIARPDVDLAPVIPVSGFAIEAIRLSYDSTDDSLSFGLQQPLSGRGTGLPVIAGDADDNGDEASVSPAVLAITPSFRDPADLGGTETMAVFLDLNRDGVADIVAGKPQVSLEVPKLYQVALAANTPGSQRPDFGASLPLNTGNVFLVNDPRHPGFEFEIRNFSELYAAFNPGDTLSPDDVISVGAFAGSLQDGSVSETFINFKSFDFGDSILPPPPDCPICPEPPPVSPPVLVNPHEHRHINSAHPTHVRVYVYGSSGFSVNNIVNETVTLGGASPVMAYNRHLNFDPFPDRVFVFRGTDIDLPPGHTVATVSGATVDGTIFSSQIPVFNRDASFYPGAARGPGAGSGTARLAGRGALVDLALADTDDPVALRPARTAGSGATTRGALPTGPTVRIPTRNGSYPTAPGRAPIITGANRPTVRIPMAPRPAPEPLPVVIPLDLAGRPSLGR